MAFREVYCRDSGKQVYRQRPDGKYEPDRVEHIESATMGSTIDWDKVALANKRSRKVVKK